MRKRGEDKENKSVWRVSERERQDVGGERRKRDGREHKETGDTKGEK